MDSSPFATYSPRFIVGGKLQLIVARRVYLGRIWHSHVIHLESLPRLCASLSSYRGRLLRSLDVGDALHATGEAVPDTCRCFRRCRVGVLTPRFFVLSLIVVCALVL